MNELIKTINYFIYRDFFFILSGSTELASLYLLLNEKNKIGKLDHIPSTFGNATPFVFLIYCIGIAYVLGYLTQELFTLFRICSSKPREKFPCIVRWFYKINPQNKILDLYPLDDVAKAKNMIYKEPDDIGMNNKARIERLASLKQIGTAIVSGFCVSGIILLFSYTVPKGIPVALIVSGIFLILFGWVKLIEQTEFAMKYFKNNPEQTNHRI